MDLIFGLFFWLNVLLADGAISEAQVCFLFAIIRAMEYLVV